jgi:hypothetical protein
MYIKIIILILLCSSLIVIAQDNEKLDLSTIADADIKRVMEGQILHIFITLNLTTKDIPNTPINESKYITDFYVPVSDAKIMVNGTAQERNAIRKQYIRRAVKNYLQFIASTVPPTINDLGTQNVTKAQIVEPGDTP